eukprot:TRINITY_DN17621_c0_g1_i1.p1 TRINITY_DN17621_c0_g1~~TRINITY_DN17621_c0_g1_i1.p1  ORF type:complete len:381 (-),score=39.62 TRINITY_DN17621_c0_g1_i1:54-1118(-)
MKSLCKALLVSRRWNSLLSFSAPLWRDTFSRDFGELPHELLHPDRWLLFCWQEEYTRRYLAARNICSSCKRSPRTGHYLLSRGILCRHCCREQLLTKEAAAKLFSLSRTDCKLLPLEKLSKEQWLLTCVPKTLKVFPLGPLRQGFYCMRSDVARLELLKKRTHPKKKPSLTLTPPSILVLPVVSVMNQKDPLEEAELAELAKQFWGEVPDQVERREAPWYLCQLYREDRRRLDSTQKRNKLVEKARAAGLREDEVAVALQEAGVSQSLSVLKKEIPPDAAQLIIDFVLERSYFSAVYVAQVVSRKLSRVRPVRAGPICMEGFVHQNNELNGRREGRKRESHFEATSHPRKRRGP